MLTEIEVLAALASQPEQQSLIKIAGGKADFSQDGFSPEQVFDGQTKDQKGWAVSPRGGMVHWANFKFAEALGMDDDVILTFKLHQYHNAEKHRLARFRISVTTDEGELPLGLPEDFVALRHTSAGSRSPESLSALVSYLNASDAEWLKLKSAVADAKKPLPEDEQVVSMRKSIERLKKETPDDPKLLQLRADHVASQQQVTNRRLTLAQDLTWALINSPAFLFNH